MSMGGRECGDEEDCMLIRMMQNVEVVYLLCPSFWFSEISIAVARVLPSTDKSRIF